MRDQILTQSCTEHNEQEEEDEDSSFWSHDQHTCLSAENKNMICSICIQEVSQLDFSMQFIYNRLICTVGFYPLVACCYGVSLHVSQLIFLTFSTEDLLWCFPGNHLSFFIPKEKSHNMRWKTCSGIDLMYWSTLSEICILVFCHSIYLLYIVLPCRLYLLNDTHK